MLIDFTSIWVLLILFALLTAVIKIWSSELPGFAARKLFHAGGGLICCFGAIICPTYKEGCLAALMATVAVIAMRIASRLGISSFLYAGSDKKSLGDILFPASVLLIAWITKIDRLTFILPVLVMSLADCSAAFVGKAMGTASLARAGEDKKTAEGSLTFFAVAFAVCAVSCAALSDIAVNKVLIISFIIALCCTMAEMFSSRGTDNIIIPVTAYLLITYLRPFSSVTLLLFAAAAALLFALSAMADKAEITTLYRAARFCVMLFIASVLFAAQHPLAMLFTAVVPLCAFLIDSKPMTSPFGTVLFSLVCVSVISEATVPGALIFIAGNTATAAYLTSKASKSDERTDKDESAGNAVFARG